MKNSQLARFLCAAAGTFLLIFMQSACRDGAQVAIRGDLKNGKSYLEGKTLYLGNRETKSFLDSTVIQNGKFEFNIRTGNGFVPFQAAIMYATGNPAWPYQLIGYRNPYFKKTFESDFYAEPGIVELTVDTIQTVGNGRKIASFKIADINRQTAVAYRHYLFKENPENSIKIRDYNRSLIKKHPYSLELLRSLNFSKSAFEEKEARYMLSLFEQELQRNPVYKVVNTYLNYENKTGSDFPADITLQTSDDHSVSKTLLDSSRHNLLVFWASWCGPCRMEIPQIKKLYQSHGDRLNIVSISIDKDQISWKKAMQKEQMPWKQFLLPLGESFAMLDKKYDLKSIPVWVLIDRKGKLVDKHVGYDTDDHALDRRVAMLLD